MTPLEREISGEPSPAPPVGVSSSSASRNSDLLLPYLAPYGAYVGVAMVAGELGRVADYAIRIGFSVLLLVYFWKHYQRLTGPRSPIGSAALGAAAGGVGVFLWIALLLPFQDPTVGDPFSPGEFLVRLAAATLVVPLIEELLFRGYVLGLVTQWQQARRSGAASPLEVALDERSVREIRPGAWGTLAVVLSSVAFAAGHSPEQWLAASSYGVLMAGLWILRQDLIAPIAAHAATNLVLYLYVYQTGSWGLW